MDHGGLRGHVGRIVVGCALVVGTAAGCDSESSDGSVEKSAGSTKTGKAKGQLKKGKKEDESKPEVPEMEPGWSATVTGPVSGEVGGSSVLRKHAGPSGKKQLVLAGLPTGEGSDDKLMFTVTKLEPNQTETHRPNAVQAYFDELKLGCTHPVAGDAGGETSFEVEFDRVTESSLQGKFRGTLRCESKAEDDEETEPKFVDVEGKFSDM